MSPIHLHCSVTRVGQGIRTTESCRIHPMDPPGKESRYNYLYIHLPHGVDSEDLRSVPGIS